VRPQCARSIRSVSLDVASDSVGDLDAEQLYGAFSVGLVALRDRQDFLNRINVFPVADGDTGTKIVATLTYALELAHVMASAGETVSSIAEAALVGARGNSGIILAQFLGGLAEGLGDAPRVSAKRLVEAAAQPEADRLVGRRGQSVLFGKAFSVRRNVEKIVEMVERSHAESPLRCYAVVHGHDRAAGDELAARFERALGFAPLYVEEISAVVALNAGRGAVAVATMAE
jgi:hypothetical protein